MARSIAWPFQLTARGGLALTPVDDQGRSELRQLVILAHLPGPSGSPWGLRAGVGAPRVAFGIDGDGAAVAPAVSHSRRFFASLEQAGRAKLRPGFPRVVRRDADGTAKTVVQIQFDDLESAQPDQVDIPGR